MIKGCDLSHWNTVVDYDKMADAGVRFCCPKLGQGQLKKDDMFDKHVAGCDRLHVPWDGYWYCDYRISGTANADQMIAKAAGNWGRRHPVMDLEFNDHFGPRPDGAHLLRFTKDFFGELEAKTGILGMFYSNKDILKQIGAAATPADIALLIRHELWMATDAPYGNPSPFPKYKLNQYELDTIVSWSDSTIDWDDFNGTEDEFVAWEGGAPQPPQPPLDKLAIVWRELQKYFPGWNYNN